LTFDNTPKNFREGPSAAIRASLAGIDPVSARASFKTFNFANEVSAEKNYFCSDLKIEG
jgi:hypothetical protein